MTVKMSKVESLYELIRLVRPLYKTLEASVALELAEVGVTVSQRAVLERLLDDGEQTVPTIGRSMIAPRQYVQTIANELLAAGHIEKRENAAHKRSVLLRLTPTGKETILAIKRREAAVMRPIASRLTASDLATAKKVIDGMIRAFHEHNVRRAAQTEGGGV